MDFEKNPLMNDISRCRREVKRWLALVALTLAALLTGMVSAVTAPSPEAQEIANFLMIASVTAIICSLFGIKQSSDHCRSVQYGLSVFEAMKKDLEGTERELTSARYDVTDAQGDLYFAKKNAKALQDELDSTKSRLASVKSELEETRGKLDLTNRILRDEIVAADNALYDAEALQSERDDLQSKLATARRFVRRLLAERNELIAERNKLRYELTEAKIGFEWFLSLYYEAEERIRFAKQQIERLETVNKLLAKFATDDV